MDYSSNVALCLNRAAAGSLTRKLSHLSKEKEENVQILALFNSAECYKAKDGAEVSSGTTSPGLWTNLRSNMWNIFWIHWKWRPSDSCASAKKPMT